MIKNLYMGLNTQVANFHVLYTKLHHFHWFVAGKDFFTLHAKFESLYEEINELYDQFAERLIIIGSKPDSSIAMYLKHTTLKESVAVKTDDMIHELMSDLTQLIQELKALILISNELGDDQTSDLLITTVSSFEKHLWMFQAFNK